VQEAVDDGNLFERMKVKEQISLSLSVMAPGKVLMLKDFSWGERKLPVKLFLGLLPPPKGEAMITPSGCISR
jgi:hypothetical protein